MERMPQHSIETDAFRDALALHQSGRVGEAASAYRRIVSGSPAHGQGLHLLGVSLCQLGSAERGVAAIARALAFHPDNAEARYNRANIRATAGAHGLAATDYRLSLVLKPDYHEAHCNLANVEAIGGQMAGSAGRLRRALAIAPTFVLARYHLGLALSNLRNYGAAAGELRRAVELNPEHADAHERLATALTILRQLAAAAAHGRKAIALRPQSAAAHYSQANVDSVANLTDDAIVRYGRALAIAPDHAYAHSNLIFSLDLVTSTLERQQRERRAWYDRHGRRFAPTAPRYAGDRRPGRRLRIGYVSADFRQHSAAYLFGPMILHRDRQEFDLVLYSGVESEDDMTARFRAASDAYRSTVDVSDEDVVARVRADAIDILVDLSGHSDGNRLLVFARKPAPVQVSGWGHVTGTGLETIDYLLADPVMLPADVRPLFAEHAFDLPCFIGYAPPAHAPAVGPAPVATGRPLTFGCLNRLSKLSGVTMDLWSRLLLERPASRLLVKDGSLSNAMERSRLAAEFERRGVTASRLVLRGRTPHIEHLATYGEVDIALDPFPQNGGTSTFEALWMGVPVVARLGATPAGRASGAILSALGLGQWVAGSDADYVEIARRLADDPARLAAIRARLRPTLASSVVCDPARYCRAVEGAYREMWRRYCERAG
jgi:predicted O-linked N-acetylglucosamine transferase (SPINDLY family)